MMKALKVTVPLVFGTVMLASVLATPASAGLAIDTGLASAQPASESTLLQPVWWHRYGWHRWGWGWGWHRRHWCYWHPRACGW